MQERAGTSPDQEPLLVHGHSSVAPSGPQGSCGGGSCHSGLSGCLRVHYNGKLRQRDEPRD